MFCKGLGKDLVIIKEKQEQSLKKTGHTHINEAFLHDQGVPSLCQILYQSILHIVAIKV